MNNDNNNDIPNPDEQEAFVKGFSEMLKNMATRPAASGQIDYEERHRTIHESMTELDNTKTLSQIQLTVLRAKKSNVTKFDDMAKLMTAKQVDFAYSNELRGHAYMRLLDTPGEAVVSSDMYLPHTNEALTQIERQVARFCAEADLHQDDPIYLGLTILLASEFAVSLIGMLSLMKDVANKYRPIIEKSLDK